MQDLNDLYFFAKVVEHRGFTPAARAIGIQKSKLSRRISLLEERLGVRLIHRSSRSFSVTEVGQEYYRQCLAMMHEAEGAQAIVDNLRSEPQGLVRMACPPGLLINHLAEVIGQFLHHHPKIDMRVKAINRRVDVIGEGYDIVIRTGQPLEEPSTLAVRKLAEVSQCLVASPLLFEGGQVPRSPREISQFPSIDFDLLHSDHPNADHQWRLKQEGQPMTVVPHNPRLVTDDVSSLREATLAGVGIAQMPSRFVAEDIAVGRLLHLIPNWWIDNVSVHALIPSRRGLFPSVRAFLDFLADACSSAKDGTIENERSVRGQAAQYAA